MLQAGVTLQGKYTIERTLGKGGMGAVYLAHHVTLAGKPVAVKEMIVDIQDDGQRVAAVQQFQREAQMLALLDHPNLVDVTDYFEENGHQYLVMGYIDGKTLSEVVDPMPGFAPIPQVLGWMDTLCDVLSYLHAQSPPIIFRDLKPDNIMLDSRERIRLVDFGIARVFEANSKTATFIRGTGTVGFSPVEQFAGNTDARSDVFALGATLYALLTRTIPPISINLMSGEEVLPAPESVNAAVSQALSSVVLKMMASRREDRYQTMTEVRQALRDLAHPSLSVPTTTAAPTVSVDTAATPTPSQATAPAPISAPTASPAVLPVTLTYRTCKRCDARLAAGAANCMICGTSVDAPAPAPRMTPTPVPAATAPKSPVGLIVGLGLVMVLILGVVWSHVHHAAPPPSTPASESWH